MIATANNRDRGVNELSSALERRFNTVVLPLPASVEQEVEIVQQRVGEMGRALDLPAEAPALEEIRRIVTIFRELRSGQTEDGKNKLKVPVGDAVDGRGDRGRQPGSVAGGPLRRRAAQAARRRRRPDRGDRPRPGPGRASVWREYLETVMKERDGWRDLYRACREAAE